MRQPKLLPILALGFSAALLAGCGVARSLTTRHKTFTYSVSLPPVPANTMAHASYTLDEQVQNTYHKYHGGIDWTRVAYHARNSSSLQPATMKLYVSLSGNLTVSQLDQQATLIDTIALSASEDRTLTMDQAPKNEALRAFLASALSQSDVSTLHFYAAAASSDPTATITMLDLTTEVEAHGSYF